MAPDLPYEIGWPIHGPLLGYPQDQGGVIREKLMDLGGHVEIVDMRVSALQYTVYDQGLLQCLEYHITAILKIYQFRWTETDRV